MPGGQSRKNSNKSNASGGKSRKSSKSSGGQSRKSSKSSGGQSRKSSKSSGKGRKRSRGSAKGSATIREEELLKAEEARLRAEEEEERLRQEKLNRKKIAREKTEALRALKPSQYETTLNWLGKPLKYIKDAYSAQKYDLEFEKFQRNGNRPDPVEVKSINTYISLLLDNKVNDMNVFGDVNLMVSLLDELTLTRKFSDDINDENMEENISNLENLIVQRYNDCTLKALQDATYIVDSDSGNLEKVCRGQHETILVWANLTRNPRMTGFQFPSERLSMDVPSIIALADVGIRILITKYDPYSKKCSTFYPKKVPEIAQEGVKLGGKKEGEGKPKGAAESKDKEHKDEEKREDVQSKGGSRPNTAATGQGGEGAGEKVEEVGAKVEVCEEDLLDPDVIDLRQFTRLGEVVRFEMLKMPPQPLVVTGGWTLTKLNDEPLTVLKYPEDVIVKEVPRDDDDEEEIVVEEPKGPPVPEQTPKLRIKMKVPDGVMFYEEPQLATWDYKDNHWKTSGFSNVVYDDVNKMISFQTEDFHTYALLQDTHLNMPFQTWELRCTGNDSALFTVIAACSENIFQIKGTEVQLMRPEESPSAEFNHFYEKWMAPEDLVALMQAAGNNIFPNVDSTNFVSVADKVIDCDPVYDQMAFLSPGFAFAWSRFSNDVRSNELVMQVIPVGEPGNNSTPIVEDERAATYIVMPDRSYKLAVTEQMVRLGYDEVKGCPCQTDLVHAIRLTPLRRDNKGDLLKALNKRVDNGNLAMVATVRFLLRATKVLTFS